MTIKKKIYVMSTLMVMVFAATSFMSFWTHHQVLTNLQIRDSVNFKLAALEEHAEWKNDFIRLMSNMAAAGRVPVFAREEFKALSNVIEEKNSALIETARTLMNIIIKKEKASRDVEKNFGKIRAKINELYFRLDKEISTALALAQMDQVLGIDAAEKSDLAPYVLKSLNQLTLTGLNALVSRKKFTEEQKGIVVKNAKFIRTQVHTIDTDKKILPLFENLFLQLNRLDEFIADSKELLSGIDKQISIADTEFKKTADSKAMDLKAAAARSEAALANKTLENASRLNFILGVICLIIVPLAAAVVGIMGLNSFIVRPISRLAKAMKNVEEGRFDVTAPAETQDEIGSLGCSFNAMTEKLHASFKKIEQKNRHLKDEHDRFLTMMDAMNALVYVTDPETYEVLFMNRYGRKIWGNRIGEKCWEVLQADQNGPCGFCGTNKMTGSGSASEGDSWEYQNTKNGEWYQCSGRRILWPGGRTVNLQVAANITKIKKAEKDHLSHLHFLQTMDRIDRVIHRASDIHRMLEDIIKTVFSVFGCDRACLIYPCDPDASVFRIPMACTAGDYPLPVDLNVDLPLSDGFERAFRDGLASDEPVIYLAGNETPFLDETEQKLGIRSQMMTALHPKMGKPWLFGIHQCSQNRLWTEEEKRLFKEIGRRIADGLSSMLLLESLRESEERYRQIVEGTDNLVTEVDHEGRFVFVNETGLKIFGLRPEECAGLSALDFIHPDDREQTLQQFDRALEKKSCFFRN